MADFYFRFLPVYKKCDTTTTHSHGPRCQPKRVFSCTSKSKLKMDSDQGWLKKSSKFGLAVASITAPATDASQKLNYFYV